MCGIFAFTGSAPDPTVLRLVIAEAGRRGPHAWGVVWQPIGWGPLERFVDVTPLTNHVEDAAALAAGSPALLGHARLATTSWGGRDDPEQVQPLLGDGLAVAHNGTIVGMEADRVRMAYGLGRPRTGNDSELLLQLLARREGDPRERMSKALIEVGGGLRPMAAVALDQTAGMLAASTGQPLYRLPRPEGTYLCSRPIPGSVRIERWAS